MKRSVAPAWLHVRAARALANICRDEEFVVIVVAADGSQSFAISESRDIREELHAFGVGLRRGDAVVMWTERSVAESFVVNVFERAK